MKQYVIDGLQPEELKTLKSYLDRKLETTPIAGTYWLELDRRVLGPMQKDHEQCGPHVFALVLEQDSLLCEFLVRIKNKIKCDCMGYANRDQREWLIETVDSMFTELNIDI
ncbi:MAG: hypothetical protein R6V41_03120 [Desulfobacteraceae bacterium]